MKEITYEEWIRNPTPRMMWVWNSNVEDKVQAKVISVVKTDACTYPVLSIMKDDVGYDTFQHCAEIEEPKTRRMTNQELSWWLRDSSRREFKYLNDGFVYFGYSYLDNEDSTLIEDDILIRENGGEWREPLVEVEE